MNTITVEEFFIIGISVRTTNENDQSSRDISELCNTFMTENTIDKIPNKIENSIYCVYTEYEKDFTKPYTALLGCKVSTLENIPIGMKGKKIETESYTKFTVKGNLFDGIVYKKWTEIWNSDLKRKYCSDFEIYNEKTSNLKNAEVSIYIS